ncbi:MAG TPA: hypothetical protein VI911_12170 [Patescibacteria group bacterium]|nr:hypothetical protein [Patescibacteria group bacterium]
MKISIEAYLKLQATVLGGIVAKEGTNNEYIDQDYGLQHRAKKTVDKLLEINNVVVDVPKIDEETTPCVCCDCKFSDNSPGEGVCGLCMWIGGYTKFEAKEADVPPEITPEKQSPNDILRLCGDCKFVRLSAYDKPCADCLNIILKPNWIRK